MQGLIVSPSKTKFFYILLPKTNSFPAENNLSPTIQRLNPLKTLPNTLWTKLSFK